MVYIQQIPWCGVGCYPGRKPFHFGTITLPSDAMQHEVETALVDFALLHIEPGFTLIECKRGSIFFSPEEQQI